MKRILTLAVLAVTGGFAFGQGQVNFINSSTQLISTNNAGTIGITVAKTAATAPSYYYGLFWGAKGTAIDGLSLLSYGTNFTAAGFLNGGTGTAAAPAVTGVAAGTSVAVLVRGWSANLGKDWNAVSAAVASINNGTASVGPSEGFYFGQSILGEVILGGGGTTTPMPVLFGTLTGQLQGFTLNYTPVPEPTTFALAGLAGAAMLIFRRRR